MMDNPFEEFITTVQELVALDGRSELASYINESNVEAFLVNHDNWNGGIDYYDIRINIPIKVFARIRSRLNEEEKAIFQAFEDVIHGREAIQLNDVKIVPSKAATISGLPESNDLSMWKYNYYRLFVSHLTDDKIRAAALKSILVRYGIDCFVAHENISPSKEWQVVIENALLSMDALCAILTPNFIKSKWCDQEVGYALGRRKIVIPIDSGAIPYGFIGKWQAIHTAGKSRVEVAKAVFDAICINEYTRGGYLDRLINLIIIAKTKDDAVQFLDVLRNIENVEKKYIEFLHSHYAENAILMDEDCLTIANVLFELNNLKTIRKRVAVESNEEQNINLPF